MCTYSAVVDQYRPWLPPPNVYPSPYPWGPTPSGPFTAPLAPQPPQAPFTLDPAQLQRLIDSFWEATRAARTFDEVTSQPDCDDPEKAALEDRVRELERRLDEHARLRPREAPDGFGEGLGGPPEGLPIQDED